MISSCMFSSAPIDAKNSETIGMVHSPPAPTAPRRSRDHRVERAQAIDDDPGAADEQHDGDHVRGGDKPAGDGDRCRERSDRRRIDPMVGAGDNQSSSGRRIVAAVEFARREQPRHGRRNDDAGEQQDERRRQAHAA